VLDRWAVLLSPRAKVIGASVDEGNWLNEALVVVDSGDLTGAFNGLSCGFVVGSPFVEVAGLPTVRVSDVAAVVDHGTDVDRVERDVVLASVSETVYMELPSTKEASSFTTSLEFLAIAIIAPTSAAVKRMAEMQMAMKHRMV
jgi:hypothetical protein